MLDLGDVFLHVRFDRILEEVVELVRREEGLDGRKRDRACTLSLVGHADERELITALNSGSEEMTEAGGTVCMSTAQSVRGGDVIEADRTLMLGVQSSIRSSTIAHGFIDETRQVMPSFLTTRNDNPTCPRVPET